MDAVIGLGSNIGDSVGTLVEAVVRIASVGQIAKISPLYRTRPVGGPPQADFLNAALLLSFEREPEALLDALLDIEIGFGRIRQERWGPRTLDLDILWSPSSVVSSPRLTIPHPRLKERAFALVPLLSIVPEARDLITGCLYAGLADGMPILGVEPIVEPRWIRTPPISNQGRP